MIFGLVAENNCHVGIFDFDIWKKTFQATKFFTTKTRELCNSFSKVHLSFVANQLTFLTAHVPHMGSEIQYTRNLK